MKSQSAGSLFGTLVVASSFALLNLVGLEASYLNRQSAYAVTSQTLEQSVAGASVAESALQPVQMARRFRSISR
jgi:hypothetical protein